MVNKGVREIGGKFRWELCYKGQRLSGTELSLPDAVVAREKKLKELKEKKVKPKTETQELSVKDILERQYETQWQTMKSAKSIRSNIHALSAYFAGRSIKSVETKDIDSYIEYMKHKGLKAATINRHLSTLSRALRHAYRRGEITQMPYITHQPERNGRIRYLTKEEEEKILEAAPNDRYKYIITVLIDTGIRCGELLKLTADDILPDQGTHGIIILNDTKNGSNRAVPLTSRAKDALMYLTSTSKGDTIITEPYIEIYNQWQEIKKKLHYENDPNFVLHMLRHTCASRLVQKGAPLKKVQSYMGHKSITTTLRYAHLSPADLFDMSDLLEV